VISIRLSPERPHYIYIGVSDFNRFHWWRGYQIIERFELHKKRTGVKVVVNLAIGGTICHNKGSHQGLNRA